jgi:hypothetical protein
MSKAQIPKTKKTNMQFFREKREKKIKIKAHQLQTTQPSMTPTVLVEKGRGDASNFMVVRHV